MIMKKITSIKNNIVIPCWFYYC